MRMSDRITSKAPPRASSRPSSPLVRARARCDRPRAASARCSRAPHGRRLLPESGACSCPSLYPRRADTRNMRTPSWTAAILAIAASACAPRFRATDLPAAPRRAPATVRVQVVEAGKPAVRSVALEEYVQATIISEFAPASGKPAVVERMLEVQAVISRTYAVAHMGRHRAQGFDLCATTHCQLFQPSRLKTSRWALAARAATLATSGAILWYGNRPASTALPCGLRRPDEQCVRRLGRPSRALLDGHQGRRPGERRPREVDI